MAERGKSRYAYISATSNTVVQTGVSTLYSVTGTFQSGTIVRVDDAPRFNQGVLDINAVGSNTVGVFGTSTTFARGLGLSNGLVVAVSSNGKVVVEYE